MRVLNCLFLLLLTLLPCVAQTPLPEKSPKFQVTHAVFTRLTHAINNLTHPGLELIARDSVKNRIIARYQPSGQPLVQLDEEAYDLCTSLGADSLNALAALLGHELAHHYRNHDWLNTYGIRQARSSNKEKIQEL